MVKEVKMYTIVCDGCGKDVNEGSEFSCWNDKSYLQDIAMEDSWVCNGDENYCTGCHYYDDEDNLVIPSKIQINDK